MWVCGEDVGVGPGGLAETPPHLVLPTSFQGPPFLMTDSQMHLTY